MTKDEFLRWDKSARDVIEIRMIYVDLTGNILTGMLLSQIVHEFSQGHATRTLITRGGQQWLAKSCAEWYDTIQFTEKRLRKHLADLESAGIIERQIFKLEGSPTMHIRIAWDVLQVGVEKLLCSDGIDVL